MELVFKYKIDEGSGSTLTEDINSNDATIVSTATSPDWITGYKGNALQFECTQVMDGIYLDLDQTPHAHAPDTIGCSEWATDGFALVTIFKRDTTKMGRDNSRVIFSMSDYPTGTGDPYFYAGFYMGVDDKLYWGCLFDQGSNRLPVACYSDNAITDDDWHIAIGRYKYGTTTTMNLWLDGVKQTDSVSNTNFNMANGPFGSLAKPMFAIGRPNNYGTSAFFPGTWTIMYGFPWDWCYGSFGGAIDESRVYCGAPTDSEVDEIYNEILGIIKRNPILFGCNT